MVTEEPSGKARGAAGAHSGSIRSSLRRDGGGPENISHRPTAMGSIMLAKAAMKSTKMFQRCGGNRSMTASLLLSFGLSRCYGLADQNLTAHFRLFPLAAGMLTGQDLGNSAAAGKSA